MLLSVIVPIYNEEQYLERCVKSLLRLNVSEYEVLLVDDGSTDKSVDICDAYDMKYDFIRAFHKEKSGVVSTRNYGLKNAKGKYIAFVDGDDWVGENIYADFISLMEKDDTLDVCIGGMRKVFPDGAEYTIGKPASARFMTNIDAMREMLKWETFRWELCGNVYRKELFKEFNLPNDIRFAEDAASSFILFQHVRKAYYAPVYQYYYFTNINSATQSNRYSILKALYIINNLEIPDEDINLRIKKLYVKKIVWDILQRFFFDDNLAENIPFYRKELKTLLEVSTIRQLIRQYFDEEKLLESLSDDTAFYDFWKAEISDFVTELAYNTSRYKNIYIYGTGVISKLMTQILKKQGISYTAYVVSDGQWKKYKSVLYLSELKDDNEDTLFILTLSERYINEIIQALENKGYAHYFAPSIIINMFR